MAKAEITMELRMLGYDRVVELIAASAPPEETIAAVGEMRAQYRIEVSDTWLDTEARFTWQGEQNQGHPLLTLVFHQAPPREPESIADWWQRRRDLALKAPLWNPES